MTDTPGMWYLFVMNSSINDFLTAMGVDVCAQLPDVKIAKTKVRTWFAREDSQAYVCFEYEGEIYRTTLRGKHQALNAAYCVEVATRLGIKREVIERALVSVPLDGRFETLNQKPMVIFDIVESADDMRNFAMCVYDYFGRKVQASLSSRDNLHPEPFKRLIIADVFYPEMAKIKQNVTIIFTRDELQKQYLLTYNGIVKTYVMEISDAVRHALKNFSDHKIFVIGGRELLHLTKSLI